MSCGGGHLGYPIGTADLVDSALVDKALVNAALVDKALVNAASVKNDVYLWIYTIKRHIVMI